jgi:hypothetical protein
LTAHNEEEDATSLSATRQAHDEQQQCHRLWLLFMVLHNGESIVPLRPN